MRVVDGYVSDRVGGVNTLCGVLVLICIALVLCDLSDASISVTTLLFTSKLMARSRSSPIANMLMNFARRVR